MTITLHEDVVVLLQDEATSLGITLEEAANFLVRFGTTHKALLCEREMYILDSSGRRIYDNERASAND